jgi:hypothetical protein
MSNDARTIKLAQIGFMKIIMTSVGILGAKGGQVLLTDYLDDRLSAKGAA